MKTHSISILSETEIPEVAKTILRFSEAKKALGRRRESRRLVQKPGYSDSMGSLMG